MHIATSSAFKENASKALSNSGLQKALARSGPSFIARRAAAVAALPEFEQLRDTARDIKNHALANLDFYLEAYEAKVLDSGGKVHWCADAGEARDTVLAICKAANARTVTKGKSMIGEEIAINDHLEQHGITPVETDLGEYIIQLRDEPPSHIIGPALHLSKEQVADTFRAAHTTLDAERPLGERQQLVAEARRVLRAQFEGADAGITGANFLAADEGAAVIVTNEGNGDLTRLLPNTHIVLTGIEKVVRDLGDVSVLLRLLTRSATGQNISTYVSVMTAPMGRAGDGPKNFHVVLLDNGRSKLIGTEAQDVLRCIRCAACLGHCPIYGAVGGHAYGATYSGPIGAALNPNLLGIKEASHHANASTFCGRCAEICPVKIPLPKIMRYWRAREYADGLAPKAAVLGLSAWAFLAKRPALYRLATALAARILKALSGRRGAVRSLPLMGGWFLVRDFPAPSGKTFHELWKAQP